MAKKYYWLKLKNDFFRSKEMKKLRKISGGDTFTIIYLKMQLLSLQNEGCLFYDGIEESFEEELALELDESADDVKVTIGFLKATGLMEQESEDTYVMTAVPELTISEGDSAERVRRHREKKRLEKALQCNALVTKCNTEIDIDIDIEKEIDIDIDKDINIKRKGVSKDTPKRKERNIPPSADEGEEHSNTRHNFQEVTKAWNELKPFGVNSVTKVVPTTERGKCLKARIADYGLDDVLKAIDLVKQSKFLQGNNDRDWKITFDWFVKPNNFIKVLEGNYTDTEPKKATDPLDRSNFDSYEEWHKAELEATFGSFDD